MISGCSNKHFKSIDHHQSFVASMNILEPSLVFYDEDGEIATWQFEDAYTGAMLLEHDRVLLYGHQVEEAKIYQLSTGKVLKKINTGIGTTNAYYDRDRKQFFLANSETNTITSFNDKGKKLRELKLSNYPMSMASYDGLLYVVNYKDTKLSVVNMDTFEIVDEWTIEKSSNGVIVVPEEKTVWIGGHGKGETPNQSIAVYNMENGQLEKNISTSLMPIEFLRQKDVVYSVNHGSNELCAYNLQGDKLWCEEVGANPFSVNTFKDYVVVAGYDDHKVYFLKDKKIVQSFDTKKGPFQLLVREAK